MITICDRVRAALGEDAVFGRPKDRAPLGQRILWHESGNQEFARADGSEHLAELTYTVDIFARKIETAMSLLSTVTEKLSGIGLRRIYMRPQLEPTDTHIVARFRALADEQGHIFQ